MWDIWARGDDTQALSQWLADNTREFVHHGKQLTARYSPDDVRALAPVMSHKFMLREAQRDALFEATGARVCVCVCGCLCFCVVCGLLVCWLAGWLVEGR